MWPALGLVGLYWAADFILRWSETEMFARFLASVASLLVLLLGFLLWWLLERRLSWADRLFGLGVAVVGGVSAALLSSKGTGVIAWLLMSLPIVLTAWTAWLLLARKAAARTRRIGLIAVLFLSWGAFTLIRMDGVKGDGQSELHWRWTPTAEELYLVHRARMPTDTDTSHALGEALVLQPSDWPGFRGPNRDGEVHGIRIATDWNTAPPRLVWRQRIGPAWSSMAIVGDRLFTQEQRGDAEAVVCLDAANGDEIWSHTDAVRFKDGQAGVGPRATPTFAANRVYALGATGILNCLDAVTGERKWFRDIAADSGATTPLWGFSSSPLVVNGVVVVFAGGDGDNGLLAYHVESGEPAWTVAAGKMSYSSPQLASLDGEDQILFLGDRGLSSLDPGSGRMLWEYDAPSKVPGLPRSIQPHPAGKAQVLIGSEAGFGTMLLDIMRDGQIWTPTQRWASRDLKPPFNDFVVYDGSIYGFDANIFCCLDLRTGERRWKQGRYGNGQVILLADQPVLVVAAEDGKAILVAANPDRHEELGRFQAIDGKTWNHPVIVNGRLYMRNAEEIACYQLKVVRQTSSTIFPSGKIRY
jgi:outer membrane protein assembly factor BamB